MFNKQRWFMVFAMSLTLFALACDDSSKTKNPDKPDVSTQPGGGDGSEIPVDTCPEECKPNEYCDIDNTCKPKNNALQPQLKVLEPANKRIVIAPDSSFVHDIKLELSNSSNNEPLPKHSVYVKRSDTSLCYFLNPSDQIVKTDDKGQVKFTLKQGDNLEGCEDSTIIFQAKVQGQVFTDKISISYGSGQNKSLTFNLKYAQEDESDLSTGSYKIAYYTGSCKELQNPASSVCIGGVYTSDGEDFDPVKTQNFNKFSHKISVEQLGDVKSAGVYLFRNQGECDDNRANVPYAWGCVDLAENQKDYDVNISVTPPVIDGVYDLRTNVDLLSGFDVKTPTDENYLKVEKMGLGDWIDWVVSVLRAPGSAMVELIYYNAFGRIPDGTPFIGQIKDVLAAFKTKGGTELDNKLREMMKGSGYLEATAEIAMIVAHTVKNLQLAGTLEISDNGTRAKYTYDRAYYVDTIKGCTESQSGVKFTCEYCKTPSGSSCWQDVSGNVKISEASIKNDVPSEYLKEVNLSQLGQSGTIATSEFNIELGERSGNNGYRQIIFNQHKLNINFGKLMYTIVFDKILPNILSYPGTGLTGLINALVFKKVIDFHNSKKYKGSTGSGDPCQELSHISPSEGKWSYCPAFVKFVAFSVACDVDGPGKTPKQTSGVLANAIYLKHIDTIICDQFGKLDELVSNLVGNLAASIKASSNDCTLYIDKNDATRIDQIGKALSFSEKGSIKKLTAVGQSVKNGKKVDGETRCLWNFNYNISDNEVTTHGLSFADYQKAK